MPPGASERRGSGPARPLVSVCFATNLSVRATAVEHALVVTKDDEWHGIMLSACPNQRLLDVIASVRGAFHRYESLLVPNDVMIERVAAEHAEIARHLADGDVAAASVALKANWMNGMQRILDNASSAYFTA